LVCLRIKDLEAQNQKVLEMLPAPEVGRPKAPVNALADALRSAVTPSTGDGSIAAVADAAERGIDAMERAARTLDEPPEGGILRNAVRGERLTGLA
jgi:hypothetical protein